MTVNAAHWHNLFHGAEHLVKDWWLKSILCVPEQHLLLTTKGNVWCLDSEGTY